MYSDPTGHWAEYSQIAKSLGYANEERWANDKWSKEDYTYVSGLGVKWTQAKTNKEKDGIKVDADLIRMKYTLLSKISGNNNSIKWGLYKIGQPEKPRWEEGKDYDEDFKYNQASKAKASDYKNWVVWGTKSTGAKVKRSDLSDAITAYDHYRSAEGTDLSIDYEKAYTEDKNINKAVNKHITDAQIAAQKLAEKSGRKSFKITGQFVPINNDGYPVTENWRKAIGAHLIWVSADVIIDENGRFKMITTVNEIDRYNFNKGMKDIDTGTPDVVNGRFAELGWAKSFNTVGQMQREVSWMNGNINSTQITKISASGGNR